MAALGRMGAYLRSLTSFQVQATTTNEDVLDDGQKVQYERSIGVVASMPDRLRVHVSDDRVDRLYVYDGKSFTLVAERANLYATVPAPPTIAQLADALEQKHGIEVPLVDLSRWGSPGWSTDAITSATDVGPAVVASATCEQYVFRQPGVDWQIWIQKGAYPLPRKLVITSTDDEARPQHTAVYTWNLAPSFNDLAFTFEPPPGAARVVLSGVGPASGANR
jgi:hypothetical protein